MSRLLASLASRCPGILRASDQAVLAGGVLLCALAMATTWLAQGGTNGQRVEFSKQPRRSAAFQLDINTASAAELDLLPDIGESRAQQIIRERQRGPFTSAEDVGHRIKGIGEKTVAKMKPYLLPLDTGDSGPRTSALVASAGLAPAEQ
jgi:competence ComEA-like helix-hairpin-helix protein